MERRKFLKGLFSAVLGVAALSSTGPAVLPETAPLADYPVTPSELHATERVIVELFEKAKREHKAGLGYGRKKRMER